MRWTQKIDFFTYNRRLKASSFFAQAIKMLLNDHKVDSCGQPHESFCGGATTFPPHFYHTSFVVEMWWITTHKLRCGGPPHFIPPHFYHISTTCISHVRAQCLHIVQVEKCALPATQPLVEMHGGLLGVASHEEKTALRAQCSGKCFLKQVECTCL